MRILIIQLTENLESYSHICFAPGDFFVGRRPIRTRETQPTWHHTIMPPRAAHFAGTGNSLCVRDCTLKCDFALEPAHATTAFVMRPAADLGVSKQIAEPLSMYNVSLYNGGRDPNLYVRLATFPLASCARHQTILCLSIRMAKVWDSTQRELAPLPFSRPCIPALHLTRSIHKIQRSGDFVEFDLNLRETLLGLFSGKRYATRMTEAPASH